MLTMIIKHQFKDQVSGCLIAPFLIMVKNYQMYYFLSILFKGESNYPG